MQTSILSIKQLIGEAQCYEAIRQLRWQTGVVCPHCDSGETIRRGYDGPERHLRRYECKACGKRFDDWTGTALSGHHQPLSVWVLCLYFMGLNRSNTQIAQELDLNQDDVQAMTECLRDGLVKKKDPVILEGVVECDETYVVAGHQGQPEKVAAAGRPPRVGPRAVVG